MTDNRKPDILLRLTHLRSCATQVRSQSSMQYSAAGANAANETPAQVTYTSTRTVVHAVFSAWSERSK